MNRPRPAALVAMLALVPLALLGAAPHGEESVKAPNRLAGEASPYLQLHAHNPVDWYPWGEEAFARARAEGKLVFLSVGYSTCYWCHVMEREVFSSQEIAAQLDAHFVSIKVDREERPDIDYIYMLATQIMTGSGGWPNSVFLTPDGRPFYAGTYFPPEDRRGLPGFPRVLDALQQTWTEDRAKVLESAARVTAQLEALAASSPPGGQPPPVDELLARAVTALRSDFDAEHGGFGRRQKFPHAPALDLLLARIERGDDPEARAMLVATLDAMALGGITDHVGDGFHRYATDRAWSVPHFEKMLYDNALLASVYARAHAATGRPLYRRVVARTLAYLEREMGRPGGGFASAQDAEVDGVEGASYVWTREQIEAVLGSKRTATLLSLYELAPMPGHGEGSVLRVRAGTAGEPGDLAARMAEFDDERAELLAARAKRDQPLRDDKVLTAWNALAIRALVDAAGALDEPAYLERAARAADFVLKALRDEDGALRRSHIGGEAREQGVLEDHAYLADALLALHAATGEPRWLAAARRIADALIARFEDPQGGGFFLTPEGSELLVRPKPFEDDALPSGNGVALRALRGLAAATGDARYAQAATRAATAGASRLARAPHALGTAVAALATTPEPAQAGSADAISTAGSEGLAMPRSQDHVRVRARHAAAGDALTVEVAIDPGWHVNANPASNRFLIPTEVTLPDGVPEARVRYPNGRDFAPAFAPEPISVYEGTVEIAVSLAEGTAPPDQVEVRYQACDETRCLSPHRARIDVETP